MEDVLIKVIRVIANLSINETIGPVLASSGQCVDLLIEILGGFYQLIITYTYMPVCYTPFAPYFMICNNRHCFIAGKAFMLFFSHIISSYNILLL